jgi:predicted ATP-grasp superfamily ATP-dependent carboligase
MSTELHPRIDVHSKAQESDHGVLLTAGKYYGTLAAARCYGRLGLPVYLADADGVSQTRWSKFVTQTARAPQVCDVGRYVEWLLEFGRKMPGLFLYSTSDDLSWVIASNREALAEHYLLYQPPLRTIVSLLDKQHLYRACTDVGISVPETYFPENDAQVREAARAIDSHILIKPRTQMLMRSKSKGLLCRDPSQLVDMYNSFRTENRYSPEIVAHDPTIGNPMLQRYHPQAMSNTYSLSGFIDETGELFVTRAAYKVFQRPRRLGVGLCFLSQPVIPSLRQKIFDLCRHVGYFGTFEAEFVHLPDSGEYLLIDFNPRFYGQMAFEIARDLPLPAFVYWAARGLSGESLRAAVRHSADCASGEYHFSHRWILNLSMITQTLAGRLSGAERRALNSVLNMPGTQRVDAVRDDLDSGPYLADILLNLKGFVRHPRHFYRTFFLDV